MDNLEITIIYNNQKIGVIPPEKTEKVLKLIKELIPEYFKTSRDKIEEIIIKVVTKEE
jgi:hypothetical protein